MTRIFSCGSYLPFLSYDNEYFSQFLNTSSDWITSRTGIKKRYFASQTETTAYMAHQAALHCLSNINFPKENIDCIIVSTSTPHRAIPAVAAEVHGALGIKPIPAYDIQAACAGFLLGLIQAHYTIASGLAEHVLLIASENYSSILDFSDRSSCVLFGDGAGAALIGKSDLAQGGGLLASCFYTDGSYASLLCTHQRGTRQYLTMMGKQVFKFAVSGMIAAIKEVANKASINLEDIDFIVPHQANLRIIHTIADKLNYPLEKMIVSLEETANIASATIPVALALNPHVLKKGNTICLTSMGAGFSWGAVLLQL